MKAYLLLLSVLIMSSFFVLRSLDTAHAAAQSACPQIAKLCPDGSSVIPTGPNCEMAICPGTSNRQLNEQIKKDSEEDENEDCNPQEDDDCAPKTDTNED